MCVLTDYRDDFIGNREFDEDRCASTVRIVVSRHRCPVRVRNAATNRQANPGASLLRRQKGIEYLL